MRFALAAATVLTVASGSAWAQPSLEGPVCPERLVPFHSFCQWQLRPSSGEWIALLAPAGETLIGTPGPDSLSAEGEGDIVEGRAGNDTLASGFNRTALIGARGNDDLSTDAITSGDAVHGIEVQIGGPGNDVHRASLGATGLETMNETLIDLGDGDDEVTAMAYLEPSDNSGKGDDNAVTNQVFGRGGDDAIDTVADAQGFYGTSLTLNAVNGGPDDDRIIVRAISEFSGAGAVTDNRT
jgi:serralysin